MADDDTTTMTMTRTDPETGEEVTTEPIDIADLRAQADEAKNSRSPYAIANVSDMVPARSCVLSAYDELTKALQVPADLGWGEYHRLDEAYASLLRAKDDLSNGLSYVRKLRDGMVASATFTQLDMQFAPAH